MPVLLLFRHKLLTHIEKKALPPGCVAGDGTGMIIARAQVDLPLNSLLGYAVAMGRAVPDAFFSVEEAAQEAGAAERIQSAAWATMPAELVTARAAGGGIPKPAVPDVIPTTDPWKLVDDGDFALAERVFAVGAGLDSVGRENCRMLLTSRVPEEVAFACRVARLTNWRSIVISVKPLLTHGHPAVRRDAVAAIGALAGPSMAGVVRPLLSDPDPGVYAAAAAALARLGG